MLTPSTSIEGENSETPMIEGKLRYEQDLYGKGAWYGKPRGFYVGLGGAYLRTYNHAGIPFTASQTFGQNGFASFPATRTTYS